MLQYQKTELLEPNRSLNVPVKKLFFLKHTFHVMCNNIPEQMTH